MKQLLQLTKTPLVLLFVWLALPAQGQTATWRSSNGSTAWTDPANWAEGVVPAAGSSVVINGCTACPVLSGDVVLNSFTVNTGGGINLQSFSITSSSAYLYFATITSTAGKIVAAAFANVAHCTFNAPSGVAGAVTLEKNGINRNGGNTFNVRATINMNAPAGAYSYLRTASHKPDVFNEEATINHLAGTGMALAHNCCGAPTFGPPVFKKKMTFNSYGEGGNLQTGRYEGEVVLNAYPNGRINVYEGTFLGALELNAHNANGGTITNLGKCTFEGPVAVNNYNKYYWGHVAFGAWGNTCTFAPTASLTIGPGGFSRGNLILENCKVQTTAPITLDLNGGPPTSDRLGKLYLSWGTAFNGPLNATAANLFMNGTTFNGDATLTKTGTGADNSAGGNAFRRKLTIVNKAGGTSPVNLATQYADFVQQ
jgi:hypothetical protein